MRRFTAARLAVSVLLISVGGLASAMFAQPQMVPVDRIIENAKAYLEDNPEDPRGHYTLGRIHYLAFANRVPVVPTFGSPEGKPPSIAPDWQARYNLQMARHSRARQLALKEMRLDEIRDIRRNRTQEFWQKVREKQQELEKEGWKPEPMPREQLFEHAVAAAESFKKAMELEPEEGLYDLGLASLYVQFLEYAEAEKIKPEDRPEPLREVTLVEALPTASAMLQ